MQSWLAEQLREAEDPTPEDAAGKLLVVLGGGQVLAAAMGTAAPGDHVLQLADQFLDSVLPTAAEADGQ
ncbi:hypothetical protein [Kitasatospora griseola]|uniref:hypothetical protein n=1 Tax=Kitasatospora griseola TaxID=2064 RepID=UPI0037FCC693